LGSPVRPPAITVFIVLVMLKVSKTNSGVKRCFKENALCLDVKFIDLFFMVPLIYFSKIFGIIIATILLIGEYFLFM
jgi:hypothetical protein